MIMDETPQTALRLRQGAEKSAKTGQCVLGRFLTGAEKALAVHQARKSGVRALFDGGWEEAERVQVCFCPEGDCRVSLCPCGDEATCDCLYGGNPFAAAAVRTEPAVWLLITWATKFAKLEHRDLLGSLMALGIDRSMFGDLVMQQDCAYLYALPEVASELQMEWHQAGNTPIRVTQMEEKPSIIPVRGQMQRTTVASLRMDAVLSAAMGTSRTKAVALIRQGDVQRNHMPEERPDVQLQEGDLLSIHGFGRVKLDSVIGMTRKEHIAIMVEVFKRDR